MTIREGLAQRFAGSNKGYCPTDEDYMKADNTIAYLRSEGLVRKVTEDLIELPLREVAPGDIGKSRKLQAEQWKCIEEAKRQGYTLTEEIR